MVTQIKMELLNEIITIKGIGNEDNIATLVKRSDTVAIYLRGGTIYEVFLIKEQKYKERIFNGLKVTYSHKELYPNNNDFGVSAWCYVSLEMAEAKFKSLND